MALFQILLFSGSGRVFFRKKRKDQYHFQLSRYKPVIKFLSQVTFTRACFHEFQQGVSVCFPCRSANPHERDGDARRLA